MDSIQGNDGKPMKAKRSLEPKTVVEIRNLFLDYFQKKGHTIVPSSSLVPVGDPTLLFTTAGMVQFKPLFTGAVPLPYTRAASAQKCLRTTDLENVGKTERHCTFFEMLGNFSFGDYFKKEAIQYALEFSIECLKIPKDRIWITIFESDDEAEVLWTHHGIPKERIVRLGKKDNFWGPAGDSGACGPCSELYLDRGREKGFLGCGDKPTCRPGCDCDRFMEYWNLVFNQFNQTPDGQLLPLKQTGIDTGAGVERIAMLLQSADSVYDTDEFSRILKEIESISGKKYNSENQVAFRVIADHSRSVYFAMGDSIYPDRTGRGYVIRRLIRRAALYARRLEIREPFLYKLIDALEAVYSPRYPELKGKKETIQKMIHSEEELFLHTLELGLRELEDILSSMEERGERVLKGKDSFRLYGTFGFPREMTRELVTERGFEFDDSSFEEELEKDRNLSRETWKGKGRSFLAGVEGISATEFVGYTTHRMKSGLVMILSPEGLRKESATVGENAVLILDRTSFYAESGGQIADQGFLKAEGTLFRVLDVQKENDVYLHIGVLLKGSLEAGMQLEGEIDSRRRSGLTVHHSGTHLLHSGLRFVLGEHVRQKASLVSDEYLRFDFSHPQPLTSEELSRVEEFVNASIQASIPVTTEVLPIEKARETGALSFFEEKYGEIVRIVRMGDQSIEFCGGTHVRNTSEIRYFSILKESSPGAGNRRIEAVCGDAVIKYYTTVFQELAEKIQSYNLGAKEVFSDPDPELITLSIPSPQEVEENFAKKGARLVSEYRALKSRLEKEWEEKTSRLFKERKKKEASGFQNNLTLIENLIQKKEDFGSVSVISAVFENVEAKSLKELGDSLKSRVENAVLLFGSRNGGTGTLVFMCNSFSVKKGVHCGELLRSSVEVLGGKGGGKPDMAQGGGKSPEKLEEAIQVAKSKLCSLL